jgi:hypothetical protein
LSSRSSASVSVVISEQSTTEVNVLCDLLFLLLRLFLGSRGVSGGSSNTSGGSS